MSSFFKLISSKAGFLTVLSSAVGTGLVTYFAAPFVLPGLDPASTVAFPLVGAVNARLGLAMFATVGAFFGEGVTQYVLPLLPQSKFLLQIENTVLAPAVAGGVAYGAMMLASPNSAAAVGAPRLILLVGVSNFLGNSLARSWQPFLKSTNG